MSKLLIFLLLFSSCEKEKETPPVCPGMEAIASAVGDLQVLYPSCLELGKCLNKKAIVKSDAEWFYEQNKIHLDPSIYSIPRGNTNFMDQMQFRCIIKENDRSLLAVNFADIVIALKICKLTESK